MKIAKKTDLRRMEQLRREMHKPEYQHRAIHAIATSLTEAMARNNRS